MFTKQAEKKKKRLPVRKLMMAVFWDRKGVLMMEFMLQGTTVTSEVLPHISYVIVGP
jgi:hypothetical protein